MQNRSSNDLSWLIFMLSDNFVVICMTLIAKEHVFKDLFSNK